MKYTKQILSYDHSGSQDIFGINKKELIDAIQNKIENVGNYSISYIEKNCRLIYENRITFIKFKEKETNGGVIFQIKSKFIDNSPEEFKNFGNVGLVLSSIKISRMYINELERPFNRLLFDFSGLRIDKSLMNKLLMSNELCCFAS